jgi:hypothetical protein
VNLAARFCRLSVCAMLDKQGDYPTLGSPVTDRVRALAAILTN